MKKTFADFLHYIILVIAIMIFKPTIQLILSRFGFHWLKTTLLEFASLLIILIITDKLLHKYLVK